MTPIKDYALIGNCETAALINPEGDIDWLCLPAFDAPAIFGALLDEKKGGEFVLRPKEAFTVERAYFEDSAILETRFKTEAGVVKLTDFFVVARKAKARFYDFTSLHPARKLVRLVELEQGNSVEMELRVCVRPDFARKTPSWREAGPGSYAVDEAALHTNIPIRRMDADLSGSFVIKAGRPLFAVLDYSAERAAPELDEIRGWLKITTAFWREWNLFNYYNGPHCKLVRRSAVTLKLLTYAQTGAFVAAPTTSLPEGLGGDLNWDYRFTWVRDTALFIQALFGLGYSGEAKAFIDFVIAKLAEKIDGSNGASANLAVEVMYPIGDRPIPPETVLDHLAGFGASRPVRVGNRATEQFQLDNYGHLLQSLFFFRHTGGKIDAQKRKVIERLIDEVKRFWQKEDNGIWEVQETSQFTYGKVMCWLALERAGQLMGDENGELDKVCTTIREDVLARGVTTQDGQKIFSAKLDEKSVDASSLLGFTIGFLPEYLAKSTREAIERALARDPLIYRSEDSEKKEGAFLMCSFWWINHLLREGQLQRAEEMLRRIIGLASPLGLFSEEIDPVSGEFLGNFPQAFSHLGFIQSVLNLENAKKMAGFYALPDHEKFTHSVGATVGLKGVIAGFFRVPKTAVLFFSSASKWR